jgi:hypothetical protein
MASALSRRRSAKDVGEGGVALGGRGLAKLGRTAGVVATFLGLVLRHAASLRRLVSFAALARSLLDIRPCLRVTAHSAVWALIADRILANIKACRGIRPRFGDHGRRDFTRQR